MVPRPGGAAQLRVHVLRGHVERRLHLRRALPAEVRSAVEAKPSTAVTLRRSPAGRCSRDTRRCSSCKKSSSKGASAASAPRGCEGNPARNALDSPGGLAQGDRSPHRGGLAQRQPHPVLQQPEAGRLLLPTAPEPGTGRVRPPVCELDSLLLTSCRHGNCEEMVQKRCLLVISRENTVLWIK